ncbi:ATP-binding protein [Vibrio alginolyticus]|nr:ATP-binding protein [Vibrio alginolyticus]
MIKKFDEINDSLTFDVDAQLITELGERLVSRNHIGISELIKNSYDADSPSVDVTLIKASENNLANSELIISDEGSGMTFETVQSRWMTIGTSNKRANPVSKVYGRPVTGNKGIGRFACQRLAESLELTTCAKTDNGFQHTTVVFDWDDFSPGKRLSKVKCQYNSFNSSEGSPGTILRLKRLREKVTERDFKMILKSITLISVATPVKRRGFEEDPGFGANITAPEFESLVGSAAFKANDKLLSSGWGTISGKISDKGLLSIELSSKDTEVQTYSYSSGKLIPLADISFKIHIVPLKVRDEIDPYRDSTLLTRKVIKDITDIHSGIKLYLNGFRVYPYGEVSEGDDWLQIAHDISRRRGSSGFIELHDIASQMGITNPNRAMLNHPGTRSLIGNIIIEGKAVNAFQVKMDREGLVATENFKNLKDAIRMSLDWATINYEAWLIKERKKKHDAVRKRFEKSVGSTFEDDRSRFTRAIETLTSGAQQAEQAEKDGQEKAQYSPETSLVKPKPFPAFKKPPILTIKPESKNDTSYSYLDNTSATSNNNEEQLNTAKAYALSQYNALEAETELLRAVSATAPLLFVFAHEVKGIAQTLETQSKRLEYIASKIDDIGLKKELKCMAESADLYQNSFNNLFGLFDVFSESSENANKKISYINLFNSVQTGFKFFIKQFNIELSFEKVNPTLRIPKLNQAEAYSVLINLLSNSIKSLIASNTVNRKVHVSIQRNGDKHILQVLDNGIGLSEEHWDKVFEARTYDPEGKLYSSVSSKLGDEKISNLGKGSGLGLNIVRNILRKHKGDVAFIKPTNGWNAAIQVKIGG